MTSGRRHQSGWLAATPRRGVRLTRPQRVLKATVVAVLSTFTALLLHVLGGGAAPGPLGVLLPIVFSILIGIPLAGRALSLVPLSIAVIVSQQLFHALFVLGAPPSSTIVSDGRHAGHGIILIPAASAVAPADAVADGGMLASHAVAAALTVLMIRRGEKALLFLARLARQVLRAILPALPRTAAMLPAEPPARPHGVTRITAPRDRWSPSISRRGPPLAPVLALS